MIAIAKYADAKTARPVEEILRGKLSDIVCQLADPETYPASFVALTIEGEKLRKILRRFFQSEAAK